ncbi:hypothetical protein HNQ82_002147 [Anoxybacillus tengchongensis]|uniref:Uncharacterized protein n=1 Tax=Anoxybacillus tengchongensis TaxID=576944 RepID=A0A7W9YSJ6_9BACL|nr:hypothetical protein [Anoxybacillus tengchongensis]MBB6177314.1 hypothetical protein [Anoxybacillus tengchongensis]
MGFFRGLGRFAGKATGTVIGGAVNVVGELTGSEWVKEVGNGVKKASEFTGDTFGQVLDGVWDTAAGIANKDEKKIEKGLEHIGESVSRTVKGVYYTAKHTYENGKEVYEGIRDNDENKLKNGLAEIAKTAAVGMLAVGVVDIIDGADYAGSIEGDIKSMDMDDDTLHQTVNHVGTAENNVGNLGKIDFVGKEDWIESNGDWMSKEDENETYLEEVEEESTGIHHIRPHWVDGYWREGQWIEGYWRDGDGNTGVNLTEEQGGGYIRTNPDGNPGNNLT